LRLILVSALAACASGDGEPTPPPPPGGTYDSGMAERNRTTITFAVDEPGDDPLVLAVHSVNSSTPLQTVPVDGPTVDVTLEDPQQTGNSYAIIGETEYATGLFPVALHLDDNSDGELDSGEEIVGADASLIFFFDDGTDPTDLQLLGLDFGWSASLAGIDGDVPISAFPTSEQATLSGTVDAPVRVVALPEAGTEQSKKGALVTQPLLDEALVGDWTLTVSGPAPDGYDPLDDSWPAGGAVALLSTYTDVDASGSFTAGDELGDPLHTCDFSPREVHLGHLPPSDSATFGWLVSEGRRGWSAMTRTTLYEGRHKAEGSTLTDVVVGPCPVEK